MLLFCGAPMLGGTLLQQLHQRFFKLSDKELCHPTILLSVIAYVKSFVNASMILKINDAEQASGGNPE